MTHDRFLLDRVSTEFVAFLGDGSAKPFASMEQWRAAKRQVDAPSEAVSKPKAPAKPKQRTKKLSYNEQREFDGMEEAILVAEEMVEALQAESNDPELANNHERMTTVWPTWPPLNPRWSVCTRVGVSSKVSRADQSSESPPDGRLGATET